MCSYYLRTAKIRRWRIFLGKAPPISMIGEYGCDTARPRTMEPFVDARQTLDFAAADYNATTDRY